MPESAIPHRRALHINADTAEARRVLKALASEPRLRMLELLSSRVYNVSEIAEVLAIPLSTATLHINALEEAGLVKSELQPAMRGRQKVCARTHDIILIELARGSTAVEQTIDFSMPVGAYVDCQVRPTCGLAGADSIIGLVDDQASFYEPDRLQAQLLWFQQGYVEYRFPNRLPPEAEADSLHLSLEICSEAPLHHENWPSDITVWLNQIEIGTWTSPADFGDVRGFLNPSWWESWNSQYGLLKVWQVNQEGSFVDGLKVSEVSIGQLQIAQRPYITMRIGVKADARRQGGLNIFGRGFGNYPQDIVMRLRYH
jgi:predicted transcriptional regulator